MVLVEVAWIFCYVNDHMHMGHSPRSKPSLAPEIVILCLLSSTKLHCLKGVASLHLLPPSSGGWHSMARVCTGWPYRGWLLPCSLMAFVWTPLP